MTQSHLLLPFVVSLLFMGIVGMEKTVIFRILYRRAALRKHENKSLVASIYKGTVAMVIAVNYVMLRKKS